MQYPVKKFEQAYSRNSILCGNKNYEVGLDLTFILPFGHKKLLHCFSFCLKFPVSNIWRDNAIHHGFGPLLCCLFIFQMTLVQQNMRVFKNILVPKHILIEIT